MTRVRATELNTARVTASRTTRGRNEMSERAFSEILSMTLEEIETPKALPIGTYLCIVKGQPEITQIGPNKTNCVIFNLEPVQAGTDVDQSQLREVLNGEALLDRKIVHRMFVTDKSKHRIKKFLADDLGIDVVC